jgi:hypothetical protein
MATLFLTLVRFDMTEADLIALAREIDPACGVGFPDDGGMDVVFSDRSTADVFYGRA